MAIHGDKCPTCGQTRKLSDIEPVVCFQSWWKSQTEKPLKNEVYRSLNDWFSHSSSGSRSICSRAV
jgi:hypothetical protein